RERWDAVTSLGSCSDAGGPLRRQSDHAADASRTSSTLFLFRPRHAGHDWSCQSSSTDRPIACFRALRLAALVRRTHFFLDWPAESGSRDVGMDLVLHNF